MSGVSIYVLMPVLPLFCARVPITSSASKPAASSIGIFIAARMSFMMGTEAWMSSGVASRCALYSGNASERNVGPWGSKATPRCVGLSLAITSWSVLQKPSTAEVFCPFEFILGFFIKA